MLRGAIFLALFGLSWAQFPPQPCESPPQWQAQRRHFDPEQGHQFAVKGQYYYDKSNLRKAMVEIAEEGRNTTYQYLHIIELFALKKRYEINIRTRECRVVPLIRPGALDGFHPHDVPAGAAYHGYFYVGTDAEEGASVEFTDWSYFYADRSYYWNGAFTSHGCIPFRSNDFNRTTFGVRYEEFWDVVPGISDPDVFIPPGNCQELLV